LQGRRFKDHLPGLLPRIDDKRWLMIRSGDRLRMLFMQVRVINGNRSQVTCMIDRKSIKCGFESRLGHRADAMTARVAVEDKFACESRDIEVVVFEADSQDQLMRTHAR
jgi:hypothetical protein